MPRRNIVIGTGEIYHVFNRSVGREKIFTSRLHLRKLTEIILYYRYPQILRLSKFKSLNDKQKLEYLFSIHNTQALVEIYAFSFMPNHFHFLIKQLQDKGIQRFISSLQNSYAKYFNLKYDRHGSLFQEQFKVKRVETEEQLLHVSRYIHLNPVTDYIIQFEQLSTYLWTSFCYYQNGTNNDFLNTELIMQLIKTKENYFTFIEDQVDYQRSLALIKDLF